MLIKLVSIGQTRSLLRILCDNAEMRSTLLPSLHPPKLITTQRDDWKVKRDLYLQIMLEEPGKDWVKLARSWKWAGKKKGVLKATILWPSTVEYDFEDRLRT